MPKLFIILITFLAMEAYGQTKVINHHNLNSVQLFSVEYLIDKNQSLSIDDAIHSTYTPTENKQCFDLSGDTSWYKITITNPLTSTTHLFLHNNRGNLSKQVDLYEISDKDTIKYQSYNFFDPQVGSMLSGSIIVYPFSISPLSTRTLYIKNKSLAYQCIDLEIHDKNTSIQALINNDFYSNIIVVVLFTMAIYNLLLYSFIRRREFIYYALYLINASIGLAYYYGIIFHHFQIYGERVYWLNLTAILGSAFLVLFVQSVIDTKKTYKTIHLLLQSVLILSILDVLIAIFFGLSLAAQLVFIIFAYSFLVLVYMAIKLYQDQHPLIRAFSLAYIAYIVGMVVVLFMFMGYIPLNEFTFHSSGIGIIIEAFLFSFLLHHRVRLLRHQKIMAEDANKRKTRFLASASHDLRQPVHALQLFSASLADEKLSSQGKINLAYMDESITSLSELLNSLSDISRLDAGIVSVNFSTVNMSLLSKRLSDNLRNQAHNKGLKLKIYCQACWVRSDRVLLENSLRNILSNAIKYTKTGGILLNCRQRKDEVWVEVWDTGAGIAESEIDFIFDEFYQVEKENRNFKQGLGLGLAIVKRKIKLLGHSISLFSREGKGTTVRIKLQRAKPTQLMDPSTKFVQAPNELAGNKVLIIDDEEAILIATKMIVSQWKCEVRTAINLDEAQSICKSFSPDIIISDFRLQDSETGINVINQLRSYLNKAIPAILITGDTSADKLQQAQECDLIILHKPANPAKLRIALSRALNA